MVNDIVLSGLINLFALFGAKAGIDAETSKGVLSTYLKRHFGIRSLDEYLGLYDDLAGLYEAEPDIDKEMIIEGICTKLRSEIPQEEQLLILLRLMEFCHLESTCFHDDDDIFQHVAHHFNVNKQLMENFHTYVKGETNKHVLVQQFPHWKGGIKTLWMEDENILVFTYMGEDEVLMNDIPVVSGIFQVWQQSGVLKSHYGAPLYFPTILEAYRQRKNRHTIHFQGRNINFLYPNSGNGCHNFSFDLESGQLVAIMGGSGSGKTTLLSLLNGNLKPQSGSITIDGHDISEDDARSLIGNVPQDDLLVEELTVWQNLLYTARFCFEGLDDKEIDSRITQVLKDLDLYQVKDLVVGSPLKKTISGGQRKRLNIALELLREPAVLFLDEPTSGLSSADTERVVLLLKEQARKGRLVITNIHQPSSDIYKLFDRLWLLDQGGYPVYDGNPIDAITTFKTAANYADSQMSMCPTCGAVNPEVILNIIDEKALSKSGKQTDKRKVTPKEWHEMYLSRKEGLSEVEVIELPPNEQHRPNLFRQFCIFLERDLKCKATNAQYILITLLEAPLLALVCAWLTHYAPETGYTLMDNKNFVSYLFMAVIVATFIGMSGSAEEIIRDRSLQKREKFLRLSYSSYIWSKVVYSVMVSLLQTALFTLVGGFVMGLMGTLSIWWLVLFVTAFLARLTGLILSQWLNSVVNIYISIPILLIPQILLCGLVVSFSDLTPRSTTGNVPLIGDVIPSRWSFEALAVSQFSSNRYEAPLFEVQRERYRLQYEQWGVIYQMKSELETMKDEQRRGIEVNPEHKQVIFTELPRLTALCELAPYKGDSSYQSIKDYLLELEDVVKTRSNRWTLLEDRITTDRIKELGKDGLRQLKRDNYNIALQDFVTGADQTSLSKIVDGHIVAKAGAVWLLPKSKCGRAPFYSSVKLIGNHSIPTLLYNMMVLCLMACVAIILLLMNIPEKLRKNINP
ncbi:MAG: ATP-binding cassette domain-containing protein [Bacteroidaceae bacterium]|nr:ATP-binding cassette domain-containing protein [Bacteroidaceae bacterium]